MKLSSSAAVTAFLFTLVSYTPSAQFLRPVTQATCIQCCDLAFGANDEGDVCRDQGCSRPDNGQQACGVLQENDADLRVACEVGRDFRFVGVSGVRNGPNDLQACNQDGTLSNFVYPPLDDPGTLNDGSCQDCCQELTNTVDGGGVEPDDHGNAFCQAACEDRNEAADCFIPEAHRDRLGCLSALDWISFGATTIHDDFDRFTCTNAGGLQGPLAPTNFPTPDPTDAPTESPIPLPTVSPTDSPTPLPTDPPTDAPSVSPIPGVTDSPTATVTNSPTDAPVTSPVAVAPGETSAPVVAPNDEPTQSPEAPGEEGDNSIVLALIGVGSGFILISLLCIAFMYGRRTEKKETLAAYGQATYGHKGTPTPWGGSIGRPPRTDMGTMQTYTSSNNGDKTVIVNLHIPAEEAQRNDFTLSRYIPSLKGKTGVIMQDDSSAVSKHSTPKYPPGFEKSRGTGRSLETFDDEVSYPTKSEDQHRSYLPEF